MRGNGNKDNGKLIQFAIGNWSSLNGEHKKFSIFQANSPRIKCEFAAYGTDIVANRIAFV